MQAKNYVAQLAYKAFRALFARHIDLRQAQEAQAVAAVRQRQAAKTPKKKPVSGEELTAAETDESLRFCNCFNCLSKTKERLS